MGLVGPNGAGKTSLCRMILGMWKPDSGVVELDGKNVFELDNDDIGQYLGVSAPECGSCLPAV